MRQLVPLILAALVPLGAAASPEAAAVAARLQGAWNEVMRAEPGCTDRRYLHRFTLSPDGLVLTQRYLVPWEGNEGLVSERRYRVLYAGPNALTLFREGETFEHRDTGDKLIRQLIVDSDTTYAWRLYGMPREHRAAAGGLRCGD